MLEDPKEDSEPNRSLPDANKLRRFSLGVGVALLIYVVAGGTFGKNLQTVLTPIVEFERPWVLLWALLLTSVYSTYRYGYYGIQLAPTRAKMRKYLQKSQSVYAFTGPEHFFKSTAEHENPTETKNCLALIYGKVPRGLPRNDCIVITNGIGDSDGIRKCVAEQLQYYFPRLTETNIGISAWKDVHWWTHVSSISFQTKALCLIEDGELWLPVFVNGLAVVALFISWSWPGIQTLFR